MTDNKLTTESIVQGLDGSDVFLRDLAGSTHTSLNEYDIGILFNIAYLCGDAADLINRQKAEIERLNDEVDKVNHDYILLCSDVAENRAEAIKGFVDRLCQKCDEYKIVLPKSNIVEKAMQLFKDMVKIVEKEMAGDS